MAESSLAISFSELYEGMKTIRVDGPTLWEKGEARLVADEDDDSVCLVSCGPEFPGPSGRVFERDDVTGERQLPERKVGELRIMGPSVMRGYWEDVERTREAFAGEFLRTGDLGF